MFVQVISIPITSVLLESVKLFSMSPSMASIIMQGMFNFQACTGALSVNSEQL